MPTTSATATHLQSIPGVGPRFEQVLRAQGFVQVEDLRGADPEAMYDQLCLQDGGYVDRCVLYTFRCAVYYAEHTQHDPELLKWWNWTDPRTDERDGRMATVRG
jgi:hypothetical protein